MKANLSQKIEKAERKVRAIYLSTYIPRKCGIATYTKDLTNAINVLNPYNLVEIMAVNDNGYDYPWEVKFRIDQLKKEDYIAAADYINKSSAEIVCIQHEYGIFGGKDGELVVDFMKRLKKPIVTTLHTVLEQPSENQKKILQEIYSLSEAVVVMISIMVERLTKIYGLTQEKVVVIPHGVPDIPYGPTKEFKHEIGMDGKFLVAVNNLVAANKGFEYLIEAAAKAKDEIPNLQVLIIGETHPTVKKYEGEKYRNSLIDLVKKLHLENTVKFINSYVGLDDLVEHLRATDVYVTPYLDPQAAASGALSYAVGAGKACISTPYIYAREVLDGDRGVLVPFRNSEEISKALVKIYKDPKFRNSIETKAYQFGRTMIWPAVALQYLDLFRAVLTENQVKKQIFGLVNPFHSREQN
jgi:polysaccharide biosynthesis protein PslF